VFPGGNQLANVLNNALFGFEGIASSYILGGLHPYPLPSAVEKQDKNYALTSLRLGAEKGPEAVIAFREKTLGRAESDEGKRRIRGNDYNALHELR